MKIIQQDNSTQSGVLSRAGQIMAGALSCFTHLSVEVSALLFVVANSGCRLIFQQLLLEKCCFHQLNYTAAICDNLYAPENQDAENVVQKLAAKFNMYDSLIENLVPVMASLFIGNWTDKYGRKPMIVFCFFTKILQQIGLILNVLYMGWSPIYMSAMSTLPSSFGAYTTFLMLAFSFMGDITSMSQRTMRMTILNLFFYAGQPIGNLAGGALYDRFGYEASFYTFTGVSALGAVYSYWRLDLFPPVRGSTTSPADKGKEQNSKEKVRDLFSLWKNGSETFQTFIRKRDGHNRAVLVLMGATLLIGLLPIYGEFDVGFLYLKKRMGWTVSEISYYNAYNTGVQVLATLTLAPMLKSGLKWKDTSVGGICVCFQAFSRIVHAFSKTTWMFIASGALYMLATVKAAVTRSIISKVVEPDELGKAYAVIGFSEAFVPIIAGIVYPEVYSSTVDRFPGAVYLISAASWTLCGILYAFVHFLHEEQGAKGKNAVENNVQGRDPDADRSHKENPSQLLTMHHIAEEASEQLNMDCSQMNETAFTSGALTSARKEPQPTLEIRL